MAKTEKKNPVKITDTTFRDGHQSSLATRMRMEDMEPLAAEMDSVGFYSLEVWGGATFDVCHRYLNEDPWERLRKFKKLMPQDPPPDAAARAEPGRLPQLRRRRGRGLRRSRPPS